MCMMSKVSHCLLARPQLNADQLLWVVPSLKDVELKLMKEENSSKDAARGQASWIASGLRIKETR